MTSYALLGLLVLQFGFGQSSLKHLHEDHYVGQQHNPEHDMNVLLGEVSKYLPLIFITIIFRYFLIFIQKLLTFLSIYFVHF